MSLRFGVLALLSGGDANGYQLKGAFEHQTGGLWSINNGQVYTTLDRLERDGLVRAAKTHDDTSRPFAITAAGRAELMAWFAQPVASADVPARDELITKVLIAIETGGVDAQAVISGQRAALIGALQAHRRRREVNTTDLSAQLAADAVVVKIEAELRWLDLCDERLRASRPKASERRRR